MIKHILLWRFQDAVREDPAQAQEILQKLSDSVSHMNGQIPGLIHAEMCWAATGILFFTVNLRTRPAWIRIRIIRCT